MIYNPHAPDWHKIPPPDIGLGDYARAWIDMEPHVGTLATLARGCRTIVEFGIRGGVSTWALLNGLAADGELHGVDVVDVTGTLPSAVRDDPRFRFVLGDSLEVELPEHADLVMIDSSHEFTQTVCELRRAATLEPAVIACHDYLYEHTPQVRWAIDGYVAKGYLRDEPYRLDRVEPSRWGLAILVRR